MNFNVDHIFSVKEKKIPLWRRGILIYYHIELKIELVLKIRNHNGSTVEQLL